MIIEDREGYFLYFLGVAIVILAMFLGAAGASWIDKTPGKDCVEACGENQVKSFSVDGVCTCRD